MTFLWIESIFETVSLLNKYTWIFKWRAESLEKIGKAWMAKNDVGKISTRSDEFIDALRIKNKCQRSQNPEHIKHRPKAN